MLTSYAHDLRDDAVLPEYPRPQLIRASYLNLNGPWDYALSADKTEPQDFDGQILVPFPPESALSGVEPPEKQREGVCQWYRRRFTLPEGFLRDRVLLHFGAVDQLAAVFVNGGEAGRHSGGYTAFTLDVTRFLREGENTLSVRAEDQLSGGPCAYGSQKRLRAWSGLWQSVWCESVPEAYIESLRLTPLPEEDVLELTVFPGGDAGEDDACRVTVQGAVYEISLRETVRIPVAGLERWTPEKPRLYGMELRLGADTVKSYFALRSLTQGKDAEGAPRLLLNGAPYFVNGVLYQGLWPDGLSTPPTDEALARDVAAARAMGFNTIRLRDKVECARFYWHCDRLGMMVWQGLPAGGQQGGLGAVASRLPVNVKDDNYGYFGRKDVEGRAQFKRELRETVWQLYNAPCVVLWELFDEGRGQFDSDALAAYAAELDDTRLIDRASGGVDQGGGKFRTLHLPGVRFKVKKDAKQRLQAVSLCGGLGYRAEGHCWSPKSTATELFDSPQRLEFALQELYDGSVRPAAAEGLAGVVYCQLTDVENDVTGLVTYDRKLCKLAPVQVKKLIRLRL